MYGPVCTVVWQGSAGDRRPYADQWVQPNMKTGGIDSIHDQCPLVGRQPGIKVETGIPHGAESFAAAIEPSELIAEEWGARQQHSSAGD